MTLSEALQQVRENYRDNALMCIEEAERGDFHVNDLPLFIQFQRDSAEAAMRGDYDTSFTFRQAVHELLTGECVPLL